ncbi:MAG: hypothetical protein Q7V88_07205 [Actinomycetota bacterium]|nr:hypothetical protein [Actinomycetota bacterium]
MLARSWWRALATLALGAVAGCALGIIARLWMRLISDDPEFTWSGTIFIVGGFTVFGLGQSIVAVARRRPRRRWKLTIVRTLGVITMLPLFVAAGGQMMPTVVGGGLALSRTEWHRITRLVWSLVAAAPVLLVGSTLVDSFGWSLQAAAGFALMLAVYATIIAATRFTFAAQRDSARMSRRSKYALIALVVVLAAIVVVASTGLG